MKLPNAEKAMIAPMKLSEYLLNESHKIGFGKAKFLRAKGFNDDNIERLATELLTLAISGNLTDIQTTQHGTKYTIVGAIQTPIGDSVLMRTVWQIDTGKENSRLITAYPET
jgi:hypothetical protein